jgi:ribonuclease HIII
MATLEDYVSSVEGTCGAEQDVIVNFRYEKKQEALDRIFKKVTIKSNLSGIVFEVTYQDRTFRLYSTGKAIFRSVKNRQELDRILAELLL